MEGEGNVRTQGQNPFPSSIWVLLIIPLLRIVDYLGKHNLLESFLLLSDTAAFSSTHPSAASVKHLCKPP